MWTFQEFPHALLKREHGADVSDAWLERVRTATIRLSNCTASFVSPEGLILTNHHCAEACLDEHSSKERNLLRRGLSRAHARTGTQVRHADRGRADGDGRHHREGGCRDPRPGRQGRQRQAQGHHDATRAACEQDSKGAKGGPYKCETVDCTRAASTGCTSTTATATCGWCSRPSAALPPSAATRTTSSSRAGAWTCRCCAPTGADGKPAATPNFLPHPCRKGRTRVNWCSSPATRATPRAC